MAIELDDRDRAILGLNSDALALRKRGDEVGLPFPAPWPMGLICAFAGTGDDDGELLGYPTRGVDGRRKAWERGDEGAKTGVPGREVRTELLKELREVGREGRLIGVRNRNGTYTASIEWHPLVFAGEACGTVMTLLTLA